MGILEDIKNGAKSPLDLIASALGTDGRRAALARLMEIDRTASEGGYVSAMNPRFAADNPELAAEYQQQIDASGLGQFGLSAGALPPGAAPRGALRPPRAVAGEVIRSEPVAPPRALPAPGEVIDGTVIPPRGMPPGSPPPGGASPSGGGPLAPSGGGPLAPSGGGPLAPSGGGPLAPSGGGPLAPSGGRPIYTTVDGGPIPPGPAGSTGGPQPSTVAAPAGGGGLLSNIRSNALGIAAGVGALGASAIAAGLVGTGRASGPKIGDATPGSAYEGGIPMEPGYAIGQEMTQAAEAKRKAQERMERGQDAEIGLTEAQAAYYRAQRERAMQELANSDLTDSEKLEVAHQYALEQARANNAAAMDREMVQQAGANERTAITEAGSNARSQFQGGVEMRGQDQRAREAQDQFVNQWFQNQVANGQLSLERATKIYDAYIKRQKLPTDIMESVSRSLTPLLPYMTNRQEGEYVPGYAPGGAYDALSSAAGVKSSNVNRTSRGSFNPLQFAAQFGAVPSTEKMPSVESVFQGAGQGADMTPENADALRQQSASGGFLPRPQLGQQMPDDIQQRILGSLR